MQEFDARAAGAPKHTKCFGQLTLHADMRKFRMLTIFPLVDLKAARRVSLSFCKSHSISATHLIRPRTAKTENFAVGY